MMKKIIISLLITVFISSCDNKSNEIKTSVINDNISSGIETINSADCSSIIEIFVDATSSVMGIWRLNSSGIIPVTESTILATEENSNDYAAFLFSAFLSKKTIQLVIYNFALNGILIS